MAINDFCLITVYVNVITPPLGIHRICNDRARGHYKCDVSRAGCYQHICAIMSGRIKGTRPLHMRRCYLVVYSKENGGLMVEKIWLFSPSTQVSQYILGLNSRTYELLVPLRSVQQPIMPGAYLIGPIQLLCVPKVKLPRLPLLGELFFEAPETTDTKLLWVRALLAKVAMPGGSSPGIFQ